MDGQTNGWIILVVTLPLLIVPFFIGFKFSMSLLTLSVLYSLLIPSPGPAVLLLRRRLLLLLLYHTALLHSLFSFSAVEERLNKGPKNARLERLGFDYVGISQG